MSTLTVISLAFLVGFVLSYKLLKREMKSILDNKHNETHFLSEEIKKFKRDVLEYYEKSSKEYEKLDAKINKMMSEAIDKANGIVKHNRQQLSKILDENAHLNLERVAGQVEKAIAALQANTASIAADSVREVMHEYRDSKRSSEIISSLCNLSKIHIK